MAKTSISVEQIPPLENGDHLTREEGIIRSQVFPGLWLDEKALLNDEMTKVLEVLQRGLNSSEHQNFKI